MLKWMETFLIYKTWSSWLSDVSERIKSELGTKKLDIDKDPTNIYAHRRSRFNPTLPLL